MNNLLILTCAEDEHVTEAEPLLKKHGVRYFRFNTEEFPQKVELIIKQSDDGKITGLIKCKDDRICLEEITHVWFRKVKPPIISSKMKEDGHRKLASQESETALYWLYQALRKAVWMNHPDYNRFAASKLRQLAVAADIGFKIPQTIITNKGEEILNFFKDHNESIIIKTMGPHAYSGSDKIYGLYTKRVTKSGLDSINLAKYCPSFLQEYIQKDIEIRVTVVNKQIFACEIHSQDRLETKDDWRHPEHVYNLKHKPHKLPCNIANKCIDFLRRFNLIFGAFDFVLTPKGEYVFLEVNSNGQWLWIEDLTSLRITEAIVKFFKNKGRR